MFRHGVPLRIVVVATALAAPAFGQTMTNPDISVIGEVRVFTHSDPNRGEERETFNLARPETELFVSGYLNPYARAAATVAWHGEGGAELEEIYATIARGLPFRASLQAGKYRLEFGRLNPVHPHAYSFLLPPLPHTVFFGSEGLNDAALRASFLVPTGSVYTEVMGAVLKGEGLFGHTHGEDEAEEGGADHAHEAPDRVNPGAFARMTSSLATSVHSELSLGFSVLNSPYPGPTDEHDDTRALMDEEEAELRAWVFGADAKYRHRPSRNRALQVEAEALLRRGERHQGRDLDALGAYGYLDYRFEQKYNGGAILEWVRQEQLLPSTVALGGTGRTLRPTDDPGCRPTSVRGRPAADGLVVPAAADPHGARIASRETWRAGLFWGFSPIEETSLVRLAGHWTEPDVGDGFWEISLQFVFSLGPHLPHNF